jgi:hypothetical protein
MADKELIIKYHAWKVRLRNSGTKLTACINVNRNGIYLGAEHIYYLIKTMTDFLGDNRQYRVINLNFLFYACL